MRGFQEQCFENPRFIRYLCPVKIDNSMEQPLQSQEKKTPLTKEEFWRRLREHKRKKEELLEQIQQEMRAEIKKRTGEDVTSFEVW